MMYEGVCASPTETGWWSSWELHLDERKASLIQFKESPWMRSEDMLNMPSLPKMTALFIIRPWLANVSDLSLIEMQGRGPKRAMYIRIPANLDEIKHFCKEDWNSTQVEGRLINSYRTIASHFTVCKCLWPARVVDYNWLGKILCICMFVVHLSLFE